MPIRSQQVGLAAAIGRSWLWQARAGLFASNSSSNAQNEPMRCPHSLSTLPPTSGPLHNDVSRENGGSQKITWWKTWTGIEGAGAWVPRPGGNVWLFGFGKTRGNSVDVPGTSHRGAGWTQVGPGTGGRVFL